MRCFVTTGRLRVGLLITLMIALPTSQTYAQALVPLRVFQGQIDLKAIGAKPFALVGTAPGIGPFRATGEVTFPRKPRAGIFLGAGVATFVNADGDLLVGAVTWEMSARGGNARTNHIEFRWRDSVRFQNGVEVANTGRFLDSRPRGLVVIAIIAILIGLMIPAVQKVKK